MGSDKEVRTIVTFKSQSFNTSEARPYFTNPCCFGDDVCHFLIGKFKEAGLECDEKPGQEDFGWYFNFKYNSQAFCLLAAFRPEEENSSSPDSGLWNLYLERAAEFIASIFGARNKGMDQALAQKLHSILSATNEFSELRWHFRRDFDASREELGTPQP